MSASPAASPRSGSSSSPSMTGETVPKDAQARDASSFSPPPPRLMLDGLDLAGTEAHEHPLRKSSVDERSQRELDLERLRAQLERSELNRSPSSTHRKELHREKSRDKDKEKEKPDTADSASPEDLRGSQRARRRVQWVGLTDDDGTHDHEKRIEKGLPSSIGGSARREGHVSVSVPSTPQSELGEPDWPAADALSDGMRTPGIDTPGSSRPGTPPEVPNIPPGERDGLPMPSERRSRTFTREAAKLVAVHKAKTMFLSKGRHSGRKHRQSSGEVSSGDASPAPAPVVAKHAVYDDELVPSRHPDPPTGGVLSALLRLYDQPQSTTSSQATLVPSAASTPSEPSTPAFGAAADARTSAVQPIGNEATAAFAQEAQRRGNAQLANMFSGAGTKIQQFRDNMDRPQSAKSQGGVFGALQQSTANLTGAASPTASTVAPASKRPGFKVNRHSSPAIPTMRTLSSVSSEPSPGQSGKASPERLFNHSKRTGSGLHLNQLAKVPENLARSGEKLARETLDPRRYHRESAALKASKSANNSPSTPGTPKNEVYEYGEEKTPIRRRKKDKKRQEEIFITMHVAAILQRQDFILRFARALMMFGAPSHRLEFQLQQTAKVLQIDCQVIYIVNFMIISFSDAETHTSDIKFIKQAGGLDLTKLTEIAVLHWEVVHDKIGVEEASVEISNLMKAKATYNNWQLVAFGACASAMIGIAAFNASFLDLLVAMPLGALLVTTQCFIAARSDVLSSIFEIVIAAVISFVAAALASTGLFCYAAVTSASIVLILPGWPTCIAALELQSRSLVSGSVRIVYAVVYSLFLGFGISLGANVWQLVSSQEVNSSNDNLCSGSHPFGGPWYQVTISQWFYFLAVPGFPIFLSLRNFAKPNKELFAMVLIAGIGWSANHFSGQYGFPGRSDISSALGAFTVGILSNIYGKMFQSTAFIVAATPIMFQLPSGLGNGGLLNWASTNADQQVVISSGWSVAQQLISVVIGLTVGLLFACAVIYPFGKRRGGLMTF